MKKTKRIIVIILALLLLAGIAVWAVRSHTGGNTPEQIKSVTIFDTDLGTDDAIAVMMIAQMDVPVDYLVATHGNASADQAVINAIILKKYFHMDDITVVAGLSPAVEDNGEKNTFHGNDGLANISEDMTANLKLGDPEFSDYITFEALCENLADVDEILYIAVGPTTNLASLIQDESLYGKIKNVYLMGGGINEFNCSHNTEFNFSKNPQAVSEVLSSGLDITLFPLDLTNHQTVDETQIRDLVEYDAFPECITFLEFNLNANDEYNQIPEAVMHDSMPVLYDANKNDFTVVDKRIVSDEYGAVFESDEGYTVHIATGAKDGLLIDTLNRVFSIESKAA